MAIYVCVADRKEVAVLSGWMDGWARWVGLVVGGTWDSSSLGQEKGGVDKKEKRGRSPRNSKKKKKKNVRENWFAF